MKTEDDIYLSDEMLREACLQATKNHSMLPIIKEELRCKIQHRRLSEGKQELDVKFTPPLKQPLTEDEIIRRDARRKCNRVSAKKCREKKKSEILSCKKELEHQQEKNKQLKRKISTMETYKHKLLEILSRRYSTEEVVVKPDTLSDALQILMINPGPNHT